MESLKAKNRHKKKLKEQKEEEDDEEEESSKKEKAKKTETAAKKKKKEKKFHLKFKFNSLCKQPGRKHFFLLLFQFLSMYMEIVQKCICAVWWIHSYYIFLCPKGI